MYNNQIQIKLSLIKQQFSMNRAEVSQQLAEIKIELIATKTKFKKIEETLVWNEFIDKEKDSSNELVHTFTSIIGQLTILEYY